MRRDMKQLLLIITIIGFILPVKAKENVKNPEEDKSGFSDPHAGRKGMKFGSDCEPATAQVDLDVNNVRTRILNGGDMWWDLNNARYEIPKLPPESNAIRKHSMFAGSIWIGGLDQAGNLKLAAMTYRQRGSDFWPGPLDPSTGNTNFSQCIAWDKIWKVDVQDIIQHVQEAEDNGSVARVHPSIQDWPASVAPYFEFNGVPGYQPEFGDYPVLQNFCRGERIEEDDNRPDDQPDQMLFFVYNDKGNIHSESQGEPIGVELKTTAFAFATNDALNDATFYTTEILNRGNTDLEETYFGQWADPDLGNYIDDYVGCNVGLSLGYCYNGNDVDVGVLGYGANPPSIGIDFFEGPKYDSITPQGDTLEIELGMSKFVYYNNDFDPRNGNPRRANDYYNYLRGRWMNGASMQYGGNGLTNTNGQECSYMFPDLTDPAFPNERWTERTAGNPPGDRRFLQSSGPFTLKPGAVNKITVGVVWARTNFGGAIGSLNLLFVASEQAQELFNNCFKLVSGPDAPPVEVVEMDKSLAISLNNYKNDRTENFDREVLNGQNELERYVFEGYRLFQTKDQSVSVAQLNDVSFAREVWQCDVKNDNAILINRVFDAEVETLVPRKMVEGENQGVTHSVKISEDAFATDANRELVNNKSYHYVLVAYAAEVGLADSLERNTEYLEGRVVRRFSARPTKLGQQGGGVLPQAAFGDVPSIKRLSGTGNGGNFLDLTDETIEQILEPPYFVKQPQYKRNAGPITVQVVDPLKVPNSKFELEMTETPNSYNPNSPSALYVGADAANTSWILRKVDDNLTVSSEVNININNQQIVNEANTGDPQKDWGLAVTINQVSPPSLDDATDNGFIDFSIEWEDPAKQWLTAIINNDAPTATQFGVFDWIRSGINFSGTFDASFQDYRIGSEALDSFSVYERIWNGRIAPYRLASANVGNARPARFIQGIAHGTNLVPNNDLRFLQSVDLVITRDPNKWSECLMIEMGEADALNEGGAFKFTPRKGNPIRHGGRTLAEGKTIFPGYAINVETGERLNIVVAEDSYQPENNGSDMKWNPTSANGFKSDLYPELGGRHYIYIMGSHEGFPASLFPKGTIYDKGDSYLNIFNNNTAQAAQDQIFHACLWAIPTYLVSGYSMNEEFDNVPLPPTDVTIKVRTKQSYGFSPINPDINDGMPKFEFNTSDLYAKYDPKYASDALKLVNIVPNPYYAYSLYERNPVDNRVRFTNLPNECTISIYTMEGGLIRRINKDNQSTTLDWDLNNNAAAPIGSGTYIIHVDAGSLGYKVLKWTGVMRELDLDSF